MAKRSHQVLEAYIEVVKDARIRKNITQKAIAERLGCTRQPISKFFNGKAVDCELFVRICEILDVDWQEVTGLEESAVNQIELESEKSAIDISFLVNKFREQVKEDIETRCGTMRILDMSQPVGLNDIYTKVNILEKISGRRRKEIAELIESCDFENFNRFNFGEIEKEKIPGKEAVNKYRTLLILGKPGAGKTTFLKHLVIQCNRGLFHGDLVPFFITLKDFAEAENQPRLLTYIGRYLEKQDRENLQQLLEQGKALICFDGLDEVLQEDSKRVIKEIRDFSANFSRNQYLLTCRIAAREYTFEQFTEVEIADFDWEQITIFATNWFQHKQVKPESFLSRLEKDEPIQELATNPLLLTLLCLVFEESGDFPGNRAGLYKEGLDALLKKWDAKRGIQRDEVYQKLWIQRKEDLLSKIAWDTFAPGEYFFKQDKVERYVGEYIRNLPGANTDEAALKLDSEVVLKSIESQHGLLVERAKHIYSFSHLTFQEYFTARKIIQVRQSSDQALEELVNHIFDKRWREVFLLAVAMSPNGEKLVLLMKEKIDYLLAEDEKIQRFLQRLNEKTVAENITFKQEDISKVQEKIDFYPDMKLSLSRCLYFHLYLSCQSQALKLPSSLSRTLSVPVYVSLLSKIDTNFSTDINVDLDALLYFSLSNSFNIDINISLFLTLDSRNFPRPPGFSQASYFSRSLKLSYILKLSQEIDRELHREIRRLNNQLPARISKKELKQWWKANGNTWREDLRKIIIKYRNIGHDWQFSNQQKELLKQYYYANQLLTQSLHQDCYVSPEVRQEIEETLLLPIDVIKQKQN
ncbi:MAG: NACHT domain-containing NTPase [Spirulinaceae cyanobacterium]